MATYVLPDELAPRLRQRLGVVDVGPALRGLRQWLRLRILTDEPMGMPSLAVQAALTEFLAITDAANQFCHGAFRHLRRHHLGNSIVPSEAVGATMALTWAMACNDQHLRAKGPEFLPTLFTVDEGMAIDGGWPWTMYCRHEPCAASDRCVHHDLLPHLPKKIPHQVIFDLPRRPPLADKSDDLWTPGNYNASN